jgi:16S rRNA processing protein RimM
MSERSFQVGKIVNTHGLRGELKIVPQTDFPDIRFAKGSRLLCFPPNGGAPVPVTVSAARFHKGNYLVKFKEFDHINEVEKFKGGSLKVSEDQLVELDEGEYYYHQIVGCQVFDEEGALLGTVKEILAPGANDVWVARTADGKELLIPYIDDVVKQVDVEAKRIVIRPLEGLFDE